MRILFAEVELAGFAENPAAGVSLNGQIAHDAVEIIGAAAMRNYARGNLALELRFRAHRVFDTTAEAQWFLLTHFASLPKEGLCEVQCGTSLTDAVSVYFPGCVLKAQPEGDFAGCSVTVAYAILAGEVTMDAWLWEAFSALLWEEDGAMLIG